MILIAKFALNQARYGRFLRTAEGIVVVGTGLYVLRKEADGAYDRLAGKSRKR